MTIAATLILALLFTATSAGKLVSHPKSLAMRDHLGVDPARWKLIGLVELAGVIGVLIGLAFTPIGVTAAAGLALLSIVATATHIRNGDGVAHALPGIVAFALSVVVVVLQVNT